MGQILTFKLNLTLKVNVTPKSTPHPPAPNSNQTRKKQKYERKTIWILTQVFCVSGLVPIGWS